jgi:hypothetical protein
MAAFVDIKVSQFFDRSKIIRRMDDKTRRVLSATGAYGRKVVGRSFPKGATAKGKKKTASRVGKPPYAHSGGTASLKGGILFAYEPRTKSVVIGPRLLNGRGEGKLQGVKTIPELLEFGGARVIKRKEKGGRAKAIRQVYKPHPFVGPTTRSFKVISEKYIELMKKYDL